MSPLFDDLEKQLRDAAQRRTRPATRWLRAGARGLPLGLAAAVVVAVVVIVLAGHGRPAGHTSAAAPGPAQLRRDVSLIERAASPVQRSAVCRRRGAQPPAVIHGRPSAALLSILGVLRRPAVAQDRMPDHAIDGVNGVYAGAARRARTTGGTTYYLVPVRQYPDAGQPTAACLDAQLAAVHRKLGSFPASDRASVWALESRLVAFDRRTLSGAPADVVCFVTRQRNGGGQGCGITVSAIRGYGGGINGNGHTDSGIVPDGVASVTLRFPASKGRPAITRTGRALGNVWVADAPAERPNVEPTVVWRAADGHVVHTISPPSRAESQAACRANPTACLALQVGSTSGGSSQASSSSASATTATSTGAP